ncbi:MAG: universal stress protein [Nitrospiraceae bacterium]|nr:universal stress protein [Nitrospiraceae bacterium]
MEDVKRILVVSRMEKASLKAFHYGLSLARDTGAELFLMHAIWNPFGFSLEGWSLPIWNLEQEYKKLVEDTKRKLHDMVAAEDKKGIKITEMVVEGEPTKEIIKTVRENDIDLLVLSGHPENRMEHMLFGRSTDELIRKLPCSVFLVKKEPDQSPRIA